MTRTCATGGHWCLHVVARRNLLLSDLWRRMSTRPLVRRHLRRPPTHRRRP